MSEIKEEGTPSSLVPLFSIFSSNPSLFLSILFSSVPLSYPFLSHSLMHATDKKAKSFSERLVTKILDNLQILINKIHIRFEDEHEGKVFTFLFSSSFLFFSLFVSSKIFTDICAWSHDRQDIATIYWRHVETQVRGFCLWHYHEGKRLTLSSYF